tara:strand:+ start:642 stop:908 length:267 start_codon:yes stop_codon:yes gene_type:complete
MDLQEIQLQEIKSPSIKNVEDLGNYVSLETEIPEALYKGMNDFIGANPHIDQYGLMSSALANFLYQNGCSDRAVTQQYLNDLFNTSNS